MALLVPDDIWAILTIWQEARGEMHIGRVAVGEVIRNRMKRKYTSDGTASGTVLKKFQFSGWNTDDPNRVACAKVDTDDPVVKDCVRAWLESSTSNFTSGAVLYYAKTMPKAPDWSLDPKVSFLTEIGNHRFYNAR
jgi:spore germination cell wall hydrolase CwlJ-like protein